MLSFHTSSVEEERWRTFLGSKMELTAAPAVLGCRGPARPELWCATSQQAASCSANRSRDKKHSVWVVMQQLPSRKVNESVLRREAGLQMHQNICLYLRFSLGLEKNLV